MTKLGFLFNLSRGFIYFYHSMEISLAAETLFHLGPVEVTNSLFSAFLIVFIIGVAAVVIGRKLSVESPSKLQLILEMILGSFRATSNDILGKLRTRSLFSFLFTFFIFIIFSNWFGLLPFVGPIVIEHHSGPEEVIEIETHDEGVSVLGCIKDRDCVLTTSGIKKIEAYPVFRAPTSDVSATLALALIAMAGIHYVGVTSLGRGYFKKYFNFSNPIDAFVGILELLSEAGKIVSFTFRLFGNIFAGEVLLIVITSISFGLATLPFLALEVFVGFIQAFVFFMLIVIFLSVAVVPHEHN